MGEDGGIRPRRPSRLVFPLLPLLSLASGCDDGAASLPGQDASASPDARWSGEVAGPGAGSDSRAPDSGDASPAAICLDVGALPCGGELTGRWKHVDFCDPQGAPASRIRDCEGPGETEPACQGAGNVRQCQPTFVGSAEFVAGGSLIVDLSVHSQVRYTFTDGCLARIRNESSARDQCRALSGPKLTCDYRPDECDCSGKTEPLAVDLTSLPYTVTGTRLTIGSGARMATGSYCVQGNRVWIRFDGPSGFEGWSAWLLER